MPRTVSIAACQFVARPVGSFDEFAAHVRGLLDRAEGADLVVFPELFTLELFTTFPGWTDLPASELTRIHAYGNTSYTEDYRRLFGGEARERGQHIAAGSHLEKRGGRYLNVAYLYGPDGLGSFTPATRRISSRPRRSGTPRRATPSRWSSFPSPRSASTCATRPRFPSAPRPSPSRAPRSSSAPRSPSRSTASGASATAPRRARSRTRCTSCTAAAAPRFRSRGRCRRPGDAVRS